MTHSENANVTEPALDRRRLLQGLAATGIAATAGCFGGDGDDDGGNTTQAQEEEDIDTSDIVMGGRLEFPVERDSVGSYDGADSTQADDSTLLNAVYDDLIAQDKSGEVYLWMAESYGTTDTQDVTKPDDYTDYMAEYEIAEVSRGAAVFDLGDDDLALMRHPDDAAAVADGDLEAGDQMRILTRSEAADAAEDGVYGTKVEGKLREGIEFHNGDECTAADVAGSYDRFVGGQLEGQVFDSLLHAEMPNGGDGYEFVLYSQEPDAQAELELPPIFIFPEEHHDISAGDLDPRADGPMPVGTGAFEVDSVEEGNELLLSQTDSYWVEEKGLDTFDWWDDVEVENKDSFPASPPIEEINVRFVPNASQRASALEEGDLDVAYQLNPEDNTAFQDDSDFRITAAKSTGFLFMQKPVTGGALENQEVRNAISALIPRQQIVDAVEDGWADPARVPFPEPASRIGTAGEYDELWDEDWAYSEEADVERAQELIDQTDLETPISVVLETNSDDEPRQNKVQLIADQLNQTDLFDASVETPANLNDWFVQDLAPPGSESGYADRNATATLGLAGGFDPHGYAKATHSPENYAGCCNFFFPEGTFDFIDQLSNARFGADVADDNDLRRERYDDLWPILANTAANTIIDFSLTVAAVNKSDVKGFNAFVDRRQYLTWSLHAPYSGQVAYLDRGSDGDGNGGDNNSSG